MVASSPITSAVVTGLDRIYQWGKLVQQKPAPAWGVAGNDIHGPAFLMAGHLGATNVRMPRWFVLPAHGG